MEMQASVNKETMEIKSLIKEEATRREEGIRDIRYEIQTKEQRLKEVTSRSSNWQTHPINVLAYMWTLL